MICFFDSDTQEHSFWNTATEREYLKTVLTKNPRDLVVMEACSLVLPRLAFRSGQTESTRIAIQTGCDLRNSGSEMQLVAVYSASGAILFHRGQAFIDSS